MTEILRFSLNKNYRNPISLDSEFSIFSGRERELRGLENIIRDRESATVLIGGVRGVGKTSFVRECLRRVQQNRKDKEYVFADISLADFDEQPNSSEIRAKVLKLLIRTLYFSLEKEDRAQLQALYDKTYYSELKETNLIELAKADVAEHKEAESKKNVYSLSVSEGLVEIIRSGLALLVGSIGLWQVAITLEGTSLTFAIIGLVTILLLILKPGFLMERTKSKESNVKKTISEKENTSGVATFDISADTLEIKLREILLNLGKEKKVVFVFDELDKIGVSNLDLKDHPVFRIIKPLKNLFSLSRSIFLFIGADDFFDKLEEEKERNPYSSFHTLFTDPHLPLKPNTLI